ncbi:MAG TPA: hypothetical protein VI006_15635 [Solirubrobacteraceae bacterium]
MLFCSETDTFSQVILEAQASAIGAAVVELAASAELRERTWEAALGRAGGVARPPRLPERTSTAAG